LADYGVVLISLEYPPYSIGGLASHTLSLAKALSKRCIKTTVFCGTLKFEESYDDNDYLRVIPLPFTNVPPRYLWFQIENAKSISKRLQGSNVVHGVDARSSLAIFHLMRKSKLPRVATLHEHPLIALKENVEIFPFEWNYRDFLVSAAYPLNNYLISKTLQYSDLIVVPGKWTKKYLISVDSRISPERVHVIYNGVNFEEIDGTPLAESEKADLNMISYGRLATTKGLTYLLHIMPRLCKDFPNLHLQIVGKGPTENSIRSQIADLNIRDKVHLRGYLPHSQLIKEIKKSDLVVLPTFHEVGPFISALEAMACSKTVVVFDLCFSREFIINMKNGLMAKAFDMNDLYDKVVMALSDGDLRGKLGRNAYEYVKKNHNWDTLVDKYIEIYKESLHR